MTVHLVLDTTAVLAYTEGSVHVGEPITQVVEEGPDARFAIPVICVLEAYREAAGAHRTAVIDLLVAHPNAAVLATPDSRWKAIADVAAILGRLDAALALDATLVHQAALLTRDTSAYGKAFDGDPPPYIIGC